MPICKPKSVVFPDPAMVAIDRDGYRVVRIETLIELKLASGLSAPQRMLIDLAEVQSLIEVLHLPLALADHLDETVRPAFRRLWELGHHPHTGPHEREPRT